MILIDDILELHKKSIIDFGGSYGIRDTGLLESAIARPFQTFGGEDLYSYSTAFEKAAALAPCWGHITAGEFSYNEGCKMI